MFKCWFFVLHVFTETPVNIAHSQKQPNTICIHRMKSDLILLQLGIVARRLCCLLNRV